MKLFKAPPHTLVRIEIIERGKESKTLSVEETDPVYVSESIKNMLKRGINVNINPLKKQNPISIQCYACTGSKKGKFSTFTTYTLNVEQIYNLIMFNLEK